VILTLTCDLRPATCLDPLPVTWTMTTTNDALRLTYDDLTTNDDDDGNYELRLCMTMMNYAGPRPTTLTMTIDALTMTNYDDDHDGRTWTMTINDYDDDDDDEMTMTITNYVCQRNYEITVNDDELRVTR